MYSYTRSAMIRLSFTQAGGVARSTAAQYQPFNWSQVSRWRWGSDPSSVSTFFPDSSVCCLLLPFRLAAMASPNLRMRSWSFAGYWRAETFLSTSLHVASEIHAFSLASYAWGFRTALRRSANIPSSLVGAVGGRRGSLLRLPRELSCSLRGDLRR